MKKSNKNLFNNQSCNCRLFPLVDTFFRRVAGHRMHLPYILALVVLLAVILAPRTSQACACGCGVFEVGDLSMFPQGRGWMVFFDYDFQDQNHNWAGDSSAPNANNADKKIETHFNTIGLQYLFSPSWGVQLEVPYDFRTFVTTSNTTGKLVKLHWSSLGDIRLKGIYTGFSPDQSIGVTFGLKLPTGDFKHNDANGDIDRDTELGTGSTDLLLGGFFNHKLTSDNKWRWFVQAEMDLPVFSQDGYCPGFELDGAAGVYYNGWSIGKAQIKPLAQVVGSLRMSDSGVNASHPVASGYERVLLSPGFEIDMHPIAVDASVDLPVYQRMTGNQLVAAALVKVAFSYKF
jgi:hypothetical protein